MKILSRGCLRFASVGDNRLPPASITPLYPQLFVKGCYSRALNNPGRRLVIKTLKSAFFISKILSPCKFGHSALSCTKTAPPAAVIDAALFCGNF